jgi:hypothetical protein
MCGYAFAHGEVSMFTAVFEVGYGRPTNVDSMLAGSLVTVVDPVPLDTFTMIGFSERSSSGRNARVVVLTSGQVDVSIVFTTDAQIAREQLVLLEDDKGMFPPYSSTLFMRYETPEHGGAAYEEVFAMAHKDLTAEAMQELNARLDLDKKTAEDVAGEYLPEPGPLQ